MIVNGINIHTLSMRIIINTGCGGDPKRQRLQSIAENGSSSSGKPENDDVPL